MSMAKTIIHFDLNRTVLMSDAAGGRGMEDTLNYLLSEVVWGKVSEVGWRPEPNITPTSVRPNTTPPLLINYKKFVDHQFPYIQDGTDAVPEGYESASTFNKVAKKQRKDLHGTFTNADQPGSSLHSSLHKLLEHMSFDQASQKQALRTAAIIEPGLLADTWRQGRHFLLPSFLYFLVHLQSNEELMDSVRIVYRTFGNDLLEVKKELDVMSSGNHPLMPGFFLDKRLTIHAPHSTFYRRGPKSNDCFLTYGTLERPKDIHESDQNVHHFYSNMKGTKVIQGFSNVLREMHVMIEADPRQCIGIRDHWDYWSANGESDNSGKPLLIDDNVVSRARERHVFVDDHVEDDHAHIVDVRNVSDGSCVAFEAAIGINMLRAHPYDAILDRDYFINLLRDVIMVKEDDGSMQRSGCGQSTEQSGEGKEVSGHQKKRAKH